MRSPLLAVLLLAAACAGTSHQAAQPTRRAASAAAVTSPARPSSAPTRDTAEYLATVCASWGDVLDAITSGGDVSAAAEETVTLANDHPPTAGEGLRDDLDTFVSDVANGHSAAEEAAPVTHDCQTR